VKVWELRQALADLQDEAVVVVRVHPPVAGWPSAFGSVRHLDAEMMLRVEAQDLELGPRHPASWVRGGRPVLELVSEVWDPETRVLAAPEPTPCAVIEAWVRDGDGR